jgi:hypothetical protein
MKSAQAEDRAAAWLSCTPGEDGSCALCRRRRFPGDGHGDVLRPPEHGDLAREGTTVRGRARHATQRCGITGERNGGQCAFAHQDRMHELDGNVRRVRRFRAFTHDQQAPTPLEAARHFQTAVRDALGVQCEEAQRHLRALREAAGYEGTQGSMSGSVGAFLIRGVSVRQRAHSIRLSVICRSSSV